MSRRGQALVDSHDPVLLIGDADVKPSLIYKDLGVTLDLHLTMVPYINQVVRSGYFHRRNISRVRRNLDDATCAAVIRSLITSRLDYANSFLYGVPECALRKLQVLETDAARVLSKMPRRDHITPVLHQLHWLSLRQRISHKVLSLVFMVLHDEAALYLP